MVTLPFLSKDDFYFTLCIVESLKGKSTVVISFYWNESVRTVLLEHLEVYLKPCKTFKI